MAILPGFRLGPYEVLSAIGARGIGEVHRARDKHLNRDVAVKVLCEVFSAGRDRMARFEREARVLVALNHPHIAAIYGLEESNSVRRSSWSWSKVQLWQTALPRGRFLSTRPTDSQTNRRGSRIRARTP